MNFNGDSKLKLNQFPLEKPDSQREKQLGKIKKLRDRGLTDDEIAELLEIPLELIAGANLEKLD